MVKSVSSNKEKTQAGSRHYIHAQDVADGLMFILNLSISTRVILVMQLVQV